MIKTSDGFPPVLVSGKKRQSRSRALGVCCRHQNNSGFDGQSLLAACRTRRQSGTQR
jgi:hypothetical protein